MKIREAGIPGSSDRVLFRRPFDGAFIYLNSKSVKDAQGGRMLDIRDAITI